ncbi:site-specific DNA-methyltransferase [Helicobacter sp. T3_23-1056]
MQSNLEQVKRDILSELKARVEDKILEQNNYELLKKLVKKAENIAEAQAISALGTTYKKTGFHFDIRLENPSNDIHFLAKDNKLSFENDKNKPTHTLIIGDNYPALLNLLIAYREKIKVIYIDPPYGKDNLGEFAQTNYDNAITRDNLLSMLKPRLELAKMLLRDDGVIFCSIDDRNQAYLKCLFDDIFGERNFVADFIRKTKSTTNDAKTGVNYQHEFLLCYAKNKDEVNLLGGQKDLSGYKNPDNDPNGDWISTDPSAKSGKAETGYFAVKNPYTGKEDYPPEGRFWLFSQNTIQKHIDEGRICFKKEHKDDERGFIYKRYLKDLKTDLTTFDSLCFDSNEFMNQNATKELKELDMVENFAYPKGIIFMQKILQHATNDNHDIVLDFFAGSGTTAHAVMELNRADNGNRKCILVTNNEITDINPNGIAIDVTTKRLKRIMSGECYDGNKDFKWREKNEPYKDNLEVYQIAKISKYAQGDNCHTEGEARSISNLKSRDISPMAQYDNVDCHESANTDSRNDDTHPLAPSAREGEQNADSLAREGDSMESPHARDGESSGNPLDLIDECAYNLPRFESIHNKAKWIAQNFGITLNTIESNAEYIKRKKGE